MLRCLIDQSGVQEHGSMWAVVVATLVFSGAFASDFSQADAVGDASDALGFTWPKPQGDLTIDDEAPKFDASDAVVFEDDAGAAATLFMTEQGKDVAGVGEAGSAGWSMVEKIDAVPADTDLSYMDTHIIHAPVEAMTVVSAHGRHSETSGMTHACSVCSHWNMDMCHCMCWHCT